MILWCWWSVTSFIFRPWYLLFVVWCMWCPLKLFSLTADSWWKSSSNVIAEIIGWEGSFSDLFRLRPLSNIREHESSNVEMILWMKWRFVARIWRWTLGIVDYILSLLLLQSQNPFCLFWYFPKTLLSLKTSVSLLHPLWCVVWAILYFFFTLLKIFIGSRSRFNSSLSILLIIICPNAVLLEDCSVLGYKGMRGNLRWIKRRILSICSTFFWIPSHSVFGYPYLYGVARERR